MTTPVITFFNNKGGVGKTSLVYHLAWMFSEQRKRVVAVDLDPQANLTAAFFDEDTLEAMWDDAKSINTIYKAVKPLSQVGDLAEPELSKISSDLYLLSGDVTLSAFEETLEGVWPESLGGKNLYRPFRILTAFWHVMQMAAQKVEADMLLIDIGPNLGAINRSVLIATNYVVIPLGADLFSLQGLKNLGPTLRDWRTEWKKRLDNWKAKEFDLPKGEMEPAGYLCQQTSVRLDRPVKAYDKWINRIPAVYRESVLTETKPPKNLVPSNDKYCLGTLKHYRSLIPLGQEHRKPIFKLTTADGAIGSHANAVQEAYKDFSVLSKKIAEVAKLDVTGVGK
ncbi:MAG: AAA family ATPase [Nitrospinae bacterium]|nr:AAA family ATPase [Nitrospinota bacterium]